MISNSQPDMTAPVTIECAFAPDANTQLYEVIDVATGTPIRQVIDNLGWFAQYPQIADYDVGVFSHKVTWDTLIKKGDRIEIYRPLTIDPIKRRALKRVRRHAKH